MPVSVTENAMAGAAALEGSVPRLAGSAEADRQRDRRGRARELESVREQVLQDLLEALGVRVDRARQVRQELDDELEPLGLGQMIERPLDEARGDPRTTSRPRRRRPSPTRSSDRSRMSLMRFRRSLPGCVDGLGELGLPRAEVAVGVLRQLVGEDQEAVQRRAELVRHVGEELGFVLRGERELRRLFLEGLPGQLDLTVLPLDSPRSGGRGAGPFLELLVGLSELGRPSDRDSGQQRLPCACSPRSCVMTILILSIEQVQEGLVRRVEAVERRQLDHAPDVALEQRPAG